MARAESMAAIDAALTAAPLQPAERTTTTQSVAAPHPAPGVNAPTPLTSSGEKKPEGDKEKSQDDIIAENEKTAQDELAEQQRQQDLFKKSANATVNAASNIVKGTSVTLERIPTPGSLVFPLIILAVFFFLLLPVNGHTRFVWIWLVLTGNAHMQPAGESLGGALGGASNNSQGSTSQDTHTNQSVDNGTSVASSLPTLPNFTFPLPMMTGVEDNLL